MTTHMPKLLVIDDLFGRNVPGGRNEDRENLCAHFLLSDVTGDAAARASRQRVLKPVAEAIFCRGQQPVCADVGDTVENDLEGTLEVVRGGWFGAEGARRRSAQALPWALVLLDLCFYTGQVTSGSHGSTPFMPEGRGGDDNPRDYFGLTLLDAIHQEFPELPIFILSSKPRDEVSYEFSRRGALGFIARDDLRAPELLKAALWQHGLLPDPAGELVGHSLPLLLALREARRAAYHRENLLIRGERGTGKELLALYVNRVSAGLSEAMGGRQSARPFVTVNSAIFTPSLFASELFGIRPQTATGVAGKIGLVESANGGDLFLDEIADMPPEVQAAMLRVLQERTITRVGDLQQTEVDVRFLSATNIDLEDGSRPFRSDLLDRLRGGGTLWLPSLRERPADILLLVEKFVREAEAQRAGALHRDVTPEALSALISYDWPGNVRELRSAIFDAVSRHPDVEHLVPGHLRLGGRLSEDGPRLRPATEAKRGAASAQTPAGLDELLASMREFVFTQATAADWSGRFGELQVACAWLMARHLKACLEATKRRTAEVPAGLIQIHPAVKLLSGDSRITASKAADMIKRILAPVEAELTGDLREAYEIAVRLRPKSWVASARREQTPQD
jgi:DNA-binding NtrC family response regulator